MTTDYSEAQSAMAQGMADFQRRQDFHQSGDAAVSLTVPVAHDTPVTGASDHPLIPAGLVAPPAEPQQPFDFEDRGEAPEPGGPQFGGVT